MRRLFCVMAILACSLISAVCINAQTAEELYRQSRFVEARASFNARTTENPKDAAAYYWLGRIRWHEDRWDDSISYMKKAVAIEPDNAEYHFWLARAYGDKMRRINIFDALGMLGNFKKENLEAIRLNPEHLDARQMWMIYNANAPAIAGGHKELAWQEVQEIGKRDQAYGLRMQAMYLDGTGDFDPKALAAFHRSVEADPLVPRSWGVWANALEAHNREKEAIAVLKEGYEKSNHNPVVLWYMGRISAEKKINLDSAVDWLSQYINAPWDIDYPSKAEAWYYLGQIYQTAGRKADARKAYQTALSILPEQQRALDGLKSL